MQKPTYSIIIPVYTGAKVIRRIAQQLLAVSSPRIELLLVDDGSTDESLAILEELAAHDKRVVVIHQQNAGPSAARNAGLGRARGRYILFCDGDDEVHTEQLCRALAHYEHDLGADMVVFAWEIIQKDSKGRVVHRRRMRQQEQYIKHDEISLKTMKSLGDDGRMYNLWNKLYDARIIRAHSLRLRQDLRFGEDLLFNLAYLKHAKCLHFSAEAPYYIYEEDSPTSIVRGSKLEYHFRQENARGLDEFGAEEKSAQMADLRTFVKWRWLVSYTLALIGSGKSFTEQCHLVKSAINDQKLRPENSSGILSKKRLLMERVWYVTSKLPVAFVLLLTCAQRLRRWRRHPEQVVELSLV